MLTPTGPHKPAAIGSRVGQVLKRQVPTTGKFRQCREIFYYSHFAVSPHPAVGRLRGAASAEEHKRAGIEHFEESRLQEALNEYNEVIQLDPEFAAAYFNRGQTYFTLGQARRALSDFDEAIGLSPNHPQLP